MNESISSDVVFHELLYGTKCLEDDRELEKNIELLDAKRRASDEQPGQYSRPSIYVEAFEQMINTVQQSESHLLTSKETNILDAFSRLCYNARYCLIRLILRKTNFWQTLVSMESFKKEVGDDGLRHAIDTLCEPITGDKTNVDEPILNPSTSGPEVIDLTGDSDNEDGSMCNNSHSEANTLKPHQSFHLSLDTMLNSGDDSERDPDFDFFLEDDSNMTLREALQKLNNDQLRDIVKQTKAKPSTMNKTGMMHALLLYASTQTPLTFHPTPKAKAEIRGDKRPRRLIPPTQERRLFQMALDKLGKSVRVNADLHWLFTRLNVIYDRCTEYPKSLLVPSLLTSFKKRSYPGYNYKRDGTIWPTRDLFIEYFEALKLETAVEDELSLPTTDSSGLKVIVATNTSKTPGLARARSRTTHMPTLPNVRESVGACKDENMEVDEPPVCKEAAEEVPIKVQIAIKVKRVFDELVLPKWRALIACKEKESVRKRTPGLERFEPGFVYTRIFSKAMRALATLKLYKEEAIALEALLEQRFWRCGKRAKWYERRAILQTRYLCFNEDAERKCDPAMLRQAMEGVQQALIDVDTGLVFRPGLVRRLRRLEKQLKIPEEQRCMCVGELRKAKVVEFSAERLYTTSKDAGMSGNGGAGSGLRSYFSTVAVKDPVKGGTSSGKENRPVTGSPSDHWKWKGKSIWKGVNDEELIVEERALQYYEALGYKGFHSESRVLTTIFSLLFWDIIFTDVPGAFETPYQTAPLDLAEDSFFQARKELIKTRLEEIKSGDRAVALLGRHDELYRERKTWCVGVRWDICERQDLLEIVKCLGGESLSVICQLFCEDYAGRNSGVPDLVVWDISKGLCKFVEVKGPGDRPQENQKLWFDSLLSAGADVEICKVLDKNQFVTNNKVLLKKKRARSSSMVNSKGKERARTGQPDDDFCPDTGFERQDPVPQKSPLVLRDRHRVSPDTNNNHLNASYPSSSPVTSHVAPIQQAGFADEVFVPRPKRRRLTLCSPSCLPEVTKFSTPL